MTKYKVEARGTYTIIKKCHWWNVGIGKDFDLAKSQALRELRFDRDAFEESIQYIEKLHPCAGCGVVTRFKFQDKYACAKHGGRTE